MSPAAVSVSLVVGVIVLGTVIGLLAGRRRAMDLEQWTVGGRHFGVVLLWLMMAGEIYTTFSFLGASGWAYSRGGPALYVLAYCPLSFVVSYFLGPAIWQAGRAHGLQTQPDYFQHRYESRLLTGIVALVGIAALVPYLQLQITGLGIIASVTSFEGIARPVAMAIGTAGIAALVFAAGVRGVAWVSMLKDFMLLGAALVIGLAVPLVHFGGVGRMFDALIAAKPGHLTMPGGTAHLGHAWYVSSVLLSALGLYVWPQNFAACYTAKSDDVIRRNAVIMPLYSLTLPFIFLAGFAAILLVPGLKDGDLALLTVARKTFPPWFLGLVGGAGSLTAMVPAALLSLTAATLFTKNLVRPLLAPSMTDHQTARLARAIVVVICAGAFLSALSSHTTLVQLLLLGYAAAAQLFPGVVLGFFWGRATRAGVFAGLIAGLACVAGMLLTGRDPFHGVNAGFLALCLNFVVTVLVSLFT